MSGQRNGGFTLIELLIALVLTGLVMTLLFNGLQLSTRSWTGTDRYQQQVAEQFQLQQRLRQLVSQARNLRVRGPDGRVSLAFQGTPAELVFVAPGRESDPSAGLYWYRLFQAEDEQPQMLKLQTRVYDPAEVVDWDSLFVPGELTPEGTEIRIEAFALMSLPTARLSLSYWEQPGPSLQSQPDWVDQSLLPRLVELQLTDIDTTAVATHRPASRSWPPLAIVLEEYNHAFRRR